MKYVLRKYGNRAYAQWVAEDPAFTASFYPPVIAVRVPVEPEKTWSDRLSEFCAAVASELAAFLGALVEGFYRARQALWQAGKLLRKAAWELDKTRRALGYFLESLWRFSLSLLPWILTAGGCYLVYLMVTGSPHNPYDVLRSYAAFVR